MLKTKIVSSQEKVFLDDKIDGFNALCEVSALRGEVLSVQLLYVDTKEGEYLPMRPFFDISLSGEIAEYATMRDVRVVPVDKPTFQGLYDSNYARTEPGVYPDILTPLRYGGKICPSRDRLRSVWIEIKIPEHYSGKYDLTVTVSEKDGTTVNTEKVTVKVIAATLPPQKTHFTQWFYPDCLAAYYNLPMWSQRHWEIVESFARVAVERGRDTMYVPVFTPALNVLPGYERLPSQLLRVSVTDGKYEFDFSLIDRYIDMCDRLGVKYLEISHFYQQDKAKHAAHIYATVDGELKRIFDWDTLSLDPEYVRFLRGFISAFVEHMRARGDDRRCIYHISDEPDLANIEQYKAVKANIADLLQGYRIIDALSDFEFYSHGALENPVPTLTASSPFIEAGIKDLWVYYACFEAVDYTNMHVAMPSYRTRSLGMQLYKHQIDGFLHWGYNYYNNRASGDAINPFMELGGEDWVPAGDCFVVYPDSDGTPLESIRLMSLLEAMQDIRAMQLCESYYSYTEVTEAIEAVLGEELSFKRCAYSSEEMLKVRETVNAMIERAVEK